MVPVEQTLLTLVWEQSQTVISQNRRTKVLRFFEPWLQMCAIEDDYWEQPQGVLDYKDVAEANIFAHLTGQKAASLFVQKGLEILIARQYFLPGQAFGLEQDPVSLIALSLNMMPEAREWLNSLLKKCLETFPQMDSKKPLFQLALFLAKEDTSSISLDPVLEVALSKIGLAKADTETRQRALRKLLNPITPEPEWAAFEAAALQELFALKSTTVDLSRPKVQEVCCILRNIPAALMRWSWEEKPKTRTSCVQRWDIQNEYHVQNLLWTILRPIFQDLRDEIYIADIGPKQPRADLLIPSLKLIIEVKFMRSAKEAKQKLLDELAADISLYSKNKQDFRELIAFIWDDSGSNQVHDELARGLNELGYFDTVFVSRPGTWLHDA